MFYGPVDDGSIFMYPFLPTRRTTNKLQLIPHHPLAQASTA